MDVFEKHFNMLRESEEMYKRYCMKKEKGIVISIEEEKNFNIKGEKLLPSETIKYLKQFRSIYYWNVVDMELKNYSLHEWIVCVEESVLLEYAIPILSRVLHEYPMLYGGNSEWQVLYEITKINREFWAVHDSWGKFFIEIICSVLSGGMEQNLTDTIPQEYLYQFRDFIASSV